MSEATKKIKNEMEKENNPYVQVVGQFLLQHLVTHPENEEKFLSEDKTIIKSLDAMRKVAEKKKVGNCAVLTDQEGFAVVLEYYGIKGDVPAFSAVPPKNEEPVPKKDDAEFNVKLEDFL